MRVGSILYTYVTLSGRRGTNFRECPRASFNGGIRGELRIQHSTSQDAHRLARVQSQAVRLRSSPCQWRENINIELKRKKKRKERFKQIERLVGRKKRENKRERKRRGNV